MAEKSWDTMEGAGLGELAEAAAPLTAPVTDPGREDPHGYLAAGPAAAARLELLEDVTNPPDLPPPYDGPTLRELVERAATRAGLNLERFPLLASLEDEIRGELRARQLNAVNIGLIAAGRQGVNEGNAVLVGAYNRALELFLRGAR